MIIESVAAASAILGSINNLIKQANETGNGVHQVMGMISDFGEGLTQFEIDRKSSTFKQLSQNDLFRITQLRKQQERYWKDVSDLLAMLDPEMLASFNQAKAEQESRRQEHLRMLAQKKKKRERLISQLLVGFTTLLVGGVFIGGGTWLFIRVYM